ARRRWGSGTLIQHLFGNPRSASGSKLYKAGRVPRISSFRSIGWISDPVSAGRRGRPHGADTAPDRDADEGRGHRSAGRSRAEIRDRNGLEAGGVSPPGPAAALAPFSCRRRAWSASRRGGRAPVARPRGLAGESGGTAGTGRAGVGRRSGLQPQAGCVLPVAAAAFVAAGRARATGLTRAGPRRRGRR